MTSASWLHRLAVAIEPIADPLLRRWRRPTADVTLVSYLGHGSSAVVVCGGRILAGPPVEPATGPERSWRRFRRMAARFATRELGGVHVRVGVGEAAATAVTDDEGYFTARLAANSYVGGFVAGRHGVTVRITDGLLADAVVHHVDDDAAVLVPAGTARHLVVSDIDDTVLATGVGRTARMVARTLTSSAWSRRPVPGIPGMLQALRVGPSGDADNPCFYVSSSPWNLYPFLRAFLDRNECPLGPLTLSDYGISNEFVIRRDHAAHKIEAIESILDVHEAMPAVLVGDITEADPMIYRHLATQHPDRVAAILLHDDCSDDVRTEHARSLFDDCPAVVAIGDAATLQHAVLHHRLGGPCTTR